MITVIDTLTSMGDYPVVKSNDVVMSNNKNLDEAINDKVDKITGKGLSTNDYTTSEKSKLAEISNIFTKIEE